MINLSKEVVILGMHRSGTSMVSGVLDRLGVNMGEDLPGRQISNPLGHFEDGDILALNESILGSAGGSWDRPPEGELLDRSGKDFEEEIRRVISGRQLANQDQLWGWKDPRTSLTINLYLPYLQNPHFIWCQRDEEAIADSLWQRNQFPQEKSMELTNHYQQQISKFILGHPEVPLLRINYRSFVEEPRRWVEKIVNFLNLDPDESQMTNAVAFILPRKMIEREKKILWWKSLLLLPGRAIRYIKNKF